jgi:hypothetical protein
MSRRRCSTERGCEPSGASAREAHRSVTPATSGSGRRINAAMDSSVRWNDGRDGSRGARTTTRSIPSQQRNVQKWTSISHAALDSSVRWNDEPLQERRATGAVVGNRSQPSSPADGRPSPRPCRPPCESASFPSSTTRPRGRSSTTVPISPASRFHELLQRLRRPRVAQDPARRQRPALGVRHLPHDPLPEPEAGGRLHPRMGRPHPAVPPRHRAAARLLDAARRLHGERRDHGRRRRPRDAGRSQRARRQPHAVRAVQHPPHRSGLHAVPRPPARSRLRPGRGIPRGEARRARTRSPGTSSRSRRCATRCAATTPTASAASTTSTWGRSNRCRARRPRDTTDVGRGQPARRASPVASL